MDCYYHPHSPLQNFCNYPGCALPLCPKCINVHLNQSQAPHEIISLDEAIAANKEQLDIAFTGLSQQLKALEKDYHPSQVCLQYKNLIDKYREEAIKEINRHYDFLFKQLQGEIQNRYSYHIQGLVEPLNEQLIQIEKYKKEINLHNKSIQTLIHVASQQTILEVESTMTRIRDKKAMFKNELPRLQDLPGNRLKMISQRYEAPIDKIYQRVQRSPQRSISSSRAVTGVDRIAQLQARLYTLRYV